MRPRELRNEGYLDLPSHFINDLDISISSLFGRKQFENIIDEDHTTLNPVLHLASNSRNSLNLCLFGMPSSVRAAAGKSDTLLSTDFMIVICIV